MYGFRAEEFPGTVTGGLCGHLAEGFRWRCGGEYCFAGVLMKADINRRVFWPKA